MINIDKKVSLRQHMSQIRRDIQNKPDLDNRIFKLILSSDVYNMADTVFLYVSTPQEIDTKRLISHSLSLGKIVAVPRCAQKGKMDFFIIENCDDLQKGAYGIFEPKPYTKKASQTENTLCIVPGLSFDLSGNRLGYGGGYYDRFLPGFPGKTVGLCYEETLCQKLPCGQYDVPVAAVVTPNRFILTDR